MGIPVTLSKVAVAMSGGIDSSIAAYLLKRKGYNVIGIFLRLYDGDKWSALRCRVREIADALKIDVYEVDARDYFKRYVVDRFLKEIEKGNTPNPCVWCNRLVKVDFLLGYAMRAFNVDLVATGHYAGVEQRGKRFLLKKGRDALKEQSYFLYMLTQKELSRLLLPLERYTKGEIKRIATDIGLNFEGIKESQDICFVEGNYEEWLVRTGIRCEPGNVVNVSGSVIGRHRGLPFYTIGQRKGLGGWGGGPYYVVEKDIDNNRVVAGRREDCLFSGALLRDVNIIYEDFFVGERDVMVKVRYGMEDVPATLYWSDGRLWVRFHVKLFGVTPGQSAVFYVGRYVFGGGIIERGVR